MKIKTVKSAQKRFKKTATGKLMYQKMSSQHLAVGKSKRTKRASKKRQTVSSADIRKIKKLIPNK